jgi:UDPglucose--hexose-1-phosphate uridylyltransferase
LQKTAGLKGKKQCPFCPSQIAQEKILYHLPLEGKDWSVIVIPNKYPFAPHHELIINTPDHKASFATMSGEQIVLALQVYRQRFNEHHIHGQVYIFHNDGEKAGASLTHSHTQLVVIPEKVFLDIPPLRTVIAESKRGLQTDHFTLFCPQTSEWPDEVWVAPKKQHRLFGEATDGELDDLAVILSSLTKIYTARYHDHFPFNFYISPDTDWYLRLIPRVKTLGGFEVGTSVSINTQDPKETMAFIKEQFQRRDIETIKQKHKASYHKAV